MSKDAQSCSGRPAAPISVGSLWFIGWLFTIGFAHLSFWKAVFALLVWPYFLGSAVG